MTNTIEHRTEIVDEFLERHGHTLPTHVIDFALDVRTLISELEEELDEEQDEEREPEPVA